MKTWHYQLQGEVRPEVDADLFVIDIDADPRPLLKRAKDVYAYLSIGEAEDYRTYWPGLPRPLILGENPDWKGNYALTFWASAWASLMVDRAREAKERGFTGLYLDKADVVLDIERRWPRIARTVDLESQMVALICLIAEAVPDLAIYMQNAECLLSNRALLKALDGWAREDWLFGEKETGEPNGEKRWDEIERIWAQSALPTIAVEYINHPSDRSFAQRYFARLGIPLFLSAEDRELAGR